MNENLVNTETKKMVETLIQHEEVGFPPGVDLQDPNEKGKYIRKKLEKNADNIDILTPSIKIMLDVVYDIIDENLQIDLYEQYYEGDEIEEEDREVNVKTLRIFKGISEENER